MALDKATRKYVERHAEPELALAAQLGCYDHVVVVPAKGETASLLDGLAPAMQRGLAIVVVNAADDEPAAVHATNEATLRQLRRYATRDLGGAAIGSVSKGYDLLVIDRASVGRRLPPREGVGLARKIGCDVALGLRLNGSLASRWIHTSDCDVRLPQDYFAASRDQTDAVALTYPFEHVACGDTAIDEAHRVYEIYLRYYVAGLVAAASPYAFFSIGSTLAVDAQAYTQVRGVPKRQAGEDFYLLNKLAKLGSVVTPASTPIAIVARRSSRVPFGTGRATAAIVASDEYRIYHPAVFEQLRRWLQALEHFALHRALPAEMGDLSDVREALDADAALEQAAAQARDSDALAERLRQWFDGFRTLRFVHLVRDLHHGTLPWRGALAAASFMDVDPTLSARAICAQLAASPV